MESVKVWICPVCEAKNSSEYCVVCGEKRPFEPAKRTGSIEKTVPPKTAKTSFSGTAGTGSPKTVKTPTAAIPERAPKAYIKKVMGKFAKEEAEAAKAAEDRAKIKGHRRKKRKAVIITIVLLFFMIVIPIALMQSNYQAAVREEKAGNYKIAYEYLSRLNTEEYVTLRRKCAYEYGVQLLNSGSAQEAKKYFIEAAGYKDAYDLKKQCDYNSAVWYMSQGKLTEAYRMFELLGNFGDSLQKLAEVTSYMYDEAVNCYRKADFVNAKSMFLSISSYQRAADYLLLIDARTTTAALSDLYALIDFEDTKSILQSDQYIKEFLIGTWKSGSDYMLEYTKNDDGGIYMQYDMPVTMLGEYWKVENGVHYNSVDKLEWTEYWHFSIIGQNEIDITMTNNGQTYRFKRS